MDILKKLKLTSPLILAPMSGVTSYPFRMLNRRFGCECAFLEMVSARSLCCASQRTTEEMMVTFPDDRPLGIQLLGEDAYYILKAIEKIQGYKFDVLDLNAACPGKKVVNKGGGAALLKEPAKLQEILKQMVRHSPVPVTVKIRLGWDKSGPAPDLALCAQDAGVAAVFLHGRTRAQGYRGRVDYAAIKKVKDVLDIPLIASGDIFSPKLTKKMFDETGCDAVVVARGALGNPWIFKMTAEYLKSGKLLEGPDIDEIIDTMKAHFDLCVEFSGEEKGVVEFRKFYIWYTRGFTKIKFLRAKTAQVKTRDQMQALMEEFRSKAKEENCRQGCFFGELNCAAEEID